MSPFLEQVKERPLHQKIIAWILTLILMAGIFWLYFYKANWEKLQDLTEQSENLEMQILEQQRIARSLPKFREETRKLDKKLENVLLQLPDKKEIAELLGSISSHAIDSGLEVINVTPQREVVRDFYAEVPVFLELEGTFHQLATFFDEVGHLSRIVNINQISVDIVTETKEEVIIRGTCMLTSFRYLDESERISKPDAAKGKRRKNKKKSRSRG